jgi:hypothetical protein
MRRRTGGVKINLHSFVPSTPVWNEQSTSRSGCFTQRKSPRYPVGRRLGGLESRPGHSGPSRESNLDSRARSTLFPDIIRRHCSICIGLLQRRNFTLTKHHAMKAYWGWMYSYTHSLTSALDGGEWSASRPGRFTPRERSPGTDWIGSWVGPRAVLDAVVKGKIIPVLN